MRRITPEGRMAEFHPAVGDIWRSRNDELEQEVFERLPAWMQTEPKDRDDLIDLQRVVPQILETITSREQKVLWCRVWADYTFDETGRVFGVTRERVRQIEAKAFRKLRHPSRSDHLRPFLNLCPIEKKKKKELNKAAQELHQKYMNKLVMKSLLEDEFQIWLKTRENT